jgi:hypothetical protein
MHCDTLRRARKAVSHLGSRASMVMALLRALFRQWLIECNVLSQHSAPVAFAAAVIRWGAAASSDVLRQRARCTACGGRGATLQHPSWAGETIGFLPFPVPDV